MADGMADAMAAGGRRPRAWSVLAVSLALMALLAALSSNGGQRQSTVDAARDRTAPVPSRAPAPATHAGADSVPGVTSRTGGTRGTGTGRTDTGRTDAPTSAALGRRTPGGAAPSDPSSNAARTGRISSALASVALASSAETEVLAPVTPPQTGSGAVGSDPGALVSTSASRGTTGSSDAAPSATGTGGPSPVASAPSPQQSPYPGHGSLSYAATSASFSVAGGDTVSAEASWTGTPALQLAIACPSGVDLGRAGASPLSVLVDDSPGAGSSCTVTLELPQGVVAEVAYTLEIEPAP